MLAPCRVAVSIHVDDFGNFLAHNPSATMCIYAAPKDVLGCFSIGDTPDQAVVKVLSWTHARELHMLQPILQDVLARPLVRGPVVWLRSAQSAAAGVNWSSDFGMCAVLVVELRVVVGED
jgi:hypothetical protein